ncbi:SOS response-associated peptidase family protein [Mesorhizobium sp.]
MANLHDRQPIILDPAAYDAWLDPATPASAAKDLLRARSRWPTAIQQSRSAGEFEQE